MKAINDYELINIIYDLIAQNPIKGFYDISHDDLTELVTEVDSTDMTITFTTEIESYQLKLTKTHQFKPPAD